MASSPLHWIPVSPWSYPRAWSILSKADGVRSRPRRPCKRCQELRSRRAAGPSGRWQGEVLGDEVMAAALIDRILHHCHTVNIRGNSYRMRQHTELWHALHEGSEESAAPSRRKAREGKTA